MKKWIILLLFSPAILKGESLVIGQFGGIDTDNSSLVTSMSPDSQNVRTDQTAGIQPRPGFTRFSTETIRNQWPFSPSNGTRYMIVQSSNILKATIGDGIFVTVISTVDPNVTTVGTQLGDNWFFSNTTNGLKYWDSNAVFTASTTMRFTQLAAHKGRLMGAGKPGSERIIFGSRFNDGTFWNLVVNPAETDPFQITVGGGLDEVLTTLYSSFRDKLIWAKTHSFGGLNGSRRSNFSVETYSDIVGTAYPETMRDCGGELRWLGTGRIVWGFDGSNLRNLNRYPEGGGVQNLMDTIMQGDANSRLWVQTTASDWNQGKRGVRISTSSSPGDVVFTSIGFNSESFNNGTCVNPIGACTDMGWTGLDDAGNMKVDGGALKGNPYGSAYVKSGIASGLWTITAPAGKFENVAASTGSFYFMCLATQNVSTSQGYRISFEGTTPNVIYRVEYTGGPGNSSGVIISSTVPRARAVQISTISVSRSDQGLFRLNIDRQFAGNGTDTTFSSSAFMSVTNGYNLGDDNIQFDSILAEDNIMFSTFTSQSFNIGNKITSWGVVTINDAPGDAAIKHVLFVSTMAGIDVFEKSSYTSSQTITTNSIPTVSTGQYVLISSSYSRTFSTQTPLVSDFTVTWNEGTNLRAASIYFDGRYKLSVSISSTANNALLVFDRRRQWQIDRGVNADVMTTYNSVPYFGSSAGIFQDESGTSDNGAVISSFYKTKSYFPGGLPHVNVFRSLFMTTENSASTLGTAYQIDGANTNYSLASRAMDFTSGFQNFNLPFTTTSLKKGRTISFTWSVDSAVDWRILGAELFFDPEKIIRAN